MRRLFVAATAAITLSACLGTTGNSIVQFRAAAAGPRDATAGSPLTFTTSLGWTVSLTTATLHVGALYLVQTLPTSGGGPSPCVLPGTYVAEVTTDAGAPAGIDVDLLSPAPQVFPSPGVGTDLLAKAGQVWLSGAQTSLGIDQVDDPTIVLHVEGTAEKDAKSFPFEANLTIGHNRVVEPTDSTKPGSEPICRQRIVSPLLVNIVPRSSGTLLLRVDPRNGLFDDIDFGTLAPSRADPTHYSFADDSSDVPSAILYSALHRSGGSPPLYQLSWEDSP